MSDSPDLAKISLIRALQLPGWKAQLAQSLDVTTTLRDRQPFSSEMNTNPTILPRLNIQSPIIGTPDETLDVIRQGLLRIYGDAIQVHSPMSEDQLWQLATYLASEHGELQLLRSMIEYQPHLARATNGFQDKTSALNIAARAGHIDIVSHLIHHGADVNQANGSGISPLLEACRNGRVEIATMLLQAGADVTRATDQGTHPLHAAVVSQSPALVDLLIRYGSPVNMQTENGSAAIHFAAKQNAMDVMKILVRHPDIDLAIQTRQKNTALSIAILNQHQDMVWFLVAAERGAQWRRPKSLSRTRSCSELQMKGVPTSRLRSQWSLEVR